jgi:hypothetical protein
MDTLWGPAILLAAFLAIMALGCMGPVPTEDDA